MNDKALTGSSFACVHYLTVWHLADVAHYLSITYTVWRPSHTYKRILYRYILSKYTFKIIIENLDHHTTITQAEIPLLFQAITNPVSIESFDVFHYQTFEFFIRISVIKNLRISIEMLIIDICIILKFSHMQIQIYVALLFSRGISACVLKATRRGSGARISAPFENFDFIFIHLYVLFTCFFLYYCCAFVGFRIRNRIW